MHQATKIVVKCVGWTRVDMYKLYTHSFNVIHLRCMLLDAIIMQGKSKLYIFTYIRKFILYVVQNWFVKTTKQLVYIREFA